MQNFVENTKLLIVVQSKNYQLPENPSSSFYSIQPLCNNLLQQYSIISLLYMRTGYSDLWNITQWTWTWRGI